MAAAAFACVLGTVGPAAAQQEDSPRNFLEVYSEGYSWFEIRRAENGDQEVVAFFTGGVELSYLGYQMSAEELRYNQATGEATVSGTVELWLNDDEEVAETRLSCSEIVIDGGAGRGRIPGPVHGELNYGRTTLDAGTAEFSFPAGRAVESASELTLRLRDGVNLATADGVSITTASAEFDGASGQVTSPGLVAITGTEPPDKAEPGVDPRWLSITGSSLTANLDDETGVEWIELAAVNAEFAGGWLSAGSARLTPLMSDGLSADPTAMAWRIQLQNGPVSGMIIEDDREVSFTAMQLAGTVDQAGIREFELNDEATVRGDEFELSSSAITVTRHANNSYSFDAPELTVARFDFSQLSGSDPLELETLQSWLD